MDRSYRIKLENFEGPLDLLLFFIHRDRLNIYDIPIANITSEFLSYLELMKTMNIDVAGEFIVMAALLMKLKARMLLPVDSSDDDDIEDPRTDLVQRLLEYQRYKEATGKMTDLREHQSYVYSKGSRMPINDVTESPSEYFKHISLLDLVKVYKNILDRLPAREPYNVAHEKIHLQDQIAYIRSQLKDCGKMYFSKIMNSLKSKLLIVVTFMALLELLRTGEVKLYQEKHF